MSIEEAIKYLADYCKALDCLGNEKSNIYLATRAIAEYYLENEMKSSQDSNEYVFGIEEDGTE